MEKLSILDLIKKVPTSQLSGLNQKGISSKEELEQEVIKFIEYLNERIGD